MPRAQYFLGFVLFSLFAMEAFSAPALKYRFPIARADRHKIASIPIMGLDHDGLGGADKTDCTNYSGASFPFCYNGHRGTDYSLIGGYATMDVKSAKIVAAASGKVTRVVDGNFDRCGIDLNTKEVSCFGHKMRANMVEIEHGNGTKTRYLHMKKGSVAVKKGQKVKCGQYLGLVGSSGKSSMPHLHFDVLDEKGKKRDPYAGRHSQSFTYWMQPYMPDGLPYDGCKALKPPPTLECVWETVQSEEHCGTEVVENALACGTELVACGTEVVKCGTETVTNAAKCGSEVVTSAVKCGTDFVTDLFKCAQKGLEIFNGGCNLPNTCEVPKTCTIDKMCSVDKLCEEAKSCTIPATCQINSCDLKGKVRLFPELRTGR